MSHRAEALLEIGKVVGTHALRGDLKVRSSSGDPDLLLTLEQLYLRLPSGELLKVKVVRQVLHKGQVLLRLQEYESINLAEGLIGAIVLLPEEEFPELPEGEYYWRELEGLQVVDQQLGDIGRLRQMFTTAAHDTYVVKGPFGEVMIPAVDQFILEVDTQAGIIRVDLPEGLVPEKQ